MIRLFNCLSVLTALGVVFVANSAHAQWGYYRVNSSYSLPSVPYAFNPVVVPGVQPITTFSPVVVNQPVAVASPAVVASGSPDSEGSDRLRSPPATSPRVVDSGPCVE